MKAVAASSIAQYEQSVLALSDYSRTIELGLSICFPDLGPMALLPQPHQPSESRVIAALIFGSDQGLVGRFNDVVALAQSA